MNETPERVKGRDTDRRGDNNLPILIRPAKRGEGTAILMIHRQAIHEIACADYSPEVLDAWGTRIHEDDLLRQGVIFDQKTERGEVVVVAESRGELVGFGEIIPDKCELLAVYVKPEFKRRGVGKAILRGLERIARERSVPYLELDSSLTAEPFYLANGYKVVGRGMHALRNGVTMACVKMRKDVGVKLLGDE